MKVHMYSDNAKINAGNTWFKAIMATEKERKSAKRKSVRDLKNLCILQENSAESIGFRRVLLGLGIYLWEHTLKVATTLLSGWRKDAVGA